MMKTVFFLLFLCFITPSGVLGNGRILLISEYDSVPPNIDGFFPPGEWSNHQIYIEGGVTTIETYVYFVNDGSNLYVMVDAIGDESDDDRDECLLSFFSNGVLTEAEIMGPDGTVKSGSFYAVIGYRDSPNNAEDHKMYEWRIPLSLINAEPGQSIDFCSPPFKHKPFETVSMPYDEETGRDNVWPEGVTYDTLETWGILKVSDLPVGGSIIQNHLNSSILYSLGMLLIMLVVAFALIR